MAAPDWWLWKGGLGWRGRSNTQIMSTQKSGWGGGAFWRWVRGGGALRPEGEGARGAGGARSCSMGNMGSGCRGFGLLVGAFCALMGVKTALAVTELPVLIQNGQVLSRLSGESSSERVYRCVVPEGAKNLTFVSASGSGDVNVYIRRGAHPTLQQFEFSSILPGNTETVRVETPVAGVWYAMLHGFGAYSGVRLRMAYELPAGRVADPVLSPGPGRLAGGVTLSMRAPTRGSVIYYTLDGSEPTPLSNRYRLPFRMETSSLVKVKAFLADGRASGVLDAMYEIAPAWPALELQSGVPLYERSGNRGSVTYFRIPVPAGRTALKVDVSGGLGDTALYVRHSYFLSVAPRYVNGPGNQASVVIPKPTEGEWYVGLRGLSDYSGVAITATLAEAKPDLIVWADACRPYITTETFAPEDCAVVEGNVVAGTRRLLRFTTDTRNIGLADLILGAPEGDSRFEFFACHGHYHFKEFASYRLLNLQGELVGTGNKASFCLEDVRQWDPRAPRRENPFNCYYQGLHMGWSDIYDSGLPGQWVDITGVPPGDYFLEVSVNPAGIIQEADYANNTSRVRVSIP